MARSFEDYDKVTVGDTFAAGAKVFGLTLAGALVGCVVPFFLLCAFDIVSAFLYILAGCSAMIFYGIFITKEARRWYDHLLLILSVGLATFFSQFLTHVVYYSSKWDIEGLSLGPLRKAVYIYFTHPVLDEITSKGIITDSGSLSVYTFLIISLVCAIVGIYVAFLFVLASDKNDGSKKRA